MVISIPKTVKNQRNLAIAFTIGLCSTLVIAGPLAYFLLARSLSTPNQETRQFNITVSPSVVTTASITPTPSLPLKVIMDVPEYKQQHKASCEVASAHSAMLYYGVDVSENDLLKIIGTDKSPRYFDKEGNLHWGNPQKAFVGNVDAKVVYIDGYGVYNQPIYKALSLKGFSKSISKTKWNTQQLYEYVRKGFPAIVWISNDYSKQVVGTMIAPDGTRNPWMNEEHAVVLRGVDKTNVYIMDVWTANYVTIEKTKFERGFANLDNMAIVVIK